MKTKFNFCLLSLILVTAACTKQKITQPATASSADKSQQTPTTFHIGDAYGGGIIYFVDTTGQHGLIAAIVDVDGTYSSFITWNNGIDTLTKAIAIGVYKGASNTDKIIAVQGSGNYAATDCRAFNAGGYTDWYLPSKREMSLLVKNRAAAGVLLGTNGYWTSTEADVSNAWIMGGSSGIKGSIIPKWIPAAVRAVRAF